MKLKIIYVHYVENLFKKFKDNIYKYNYITYYNDTTRKINIFKIYTTI